MKKAFWLRSSKKRKPKTAPKQLRPVVKKAKPAPWIPPHPVKPKASEEHTELRIEPPVTYELPPMAEEAQVIPMSTPYSGQQKTSPRNRSAKRDFLKTFHTLTRRWRAWDIWSDFITMMACTISNSVDKSHYDEREATYLRIINKYSKQEQELFPELLAYTVVALEEDPEQDFLGTLYTELSLNDKERQQEFTPYSVCRLMAEITLGDIVAKVEEKGFIEIHDCCCGAGAILIAAANVAREKLEMVGLNYQNHILVTGQDIDHVVAMMCYIQLSLLGIAGYFKVGNSLTEPMTDGDSLESYWFTPMYFFPVWNYRRIWRSLDRLTTEPKHEQSTRKFELGPIVITTSVSEQMEANAGFDCFVKSSFERFKNCDWGDLCDEDKVAMDKAVTDGLMLMGSYKHDDVEIWIITEWDRSATTILFPHER